MSRRGLTLLEVLISTLLLTAMTVACLPLFRGALHAMAAGAPGPAGPDRIDLAELAEAVLAAPQRAGVESAAALDGARLEWPEQPEWPVVEVHRLVASGGGPDESMNEPAGQAAEPVTHCWYRFAAGEVVVHRWASLDETPAAGENEPVPGTDGPDGRAANPGGGS